VHKISGILPKIYKHTCVVLSGPFPRARQANLLMLQQSMTHSCFYSFLFCTNKIRSSVWRWL